MERSIEIGNHEGKRGKWIHVDRIDDRRVHRRNSGHAGRAILPRDIAESQRSRTAPGLITMREVLDQHRADQGKYPPSLRALVDAGYLRAIPNDPFTNLATTWQEITTPVEEGVVDVFSGSDLVGTNGEPYNRW